MLCSKQHIIENIQPIIFKISVPLFTFKFQIVHKSLKAYQSENRNYPYNLSNLQNFTYNFHQQQFFRETSETLHASAK